MPTVKAKTVQSETAWKSPDGQRTIWKLLLHLDGTDHSVEAKTYSPVIAKPGWEGTVETSEKQGRYGIETFVKQPPKEGGGYQANLGSPTENRGGSSGRPPADNFTMYLSYAKDVAIACIRDGAFDTELYNEILASVQTGGQELFDGRPGGSKPPAPVPKELDEAFGDPRPMAEEELWASDL